MPCVTQESNGTQALWNGSSRLKCSGWAGALFSQSAPPWAACCPASCAAGGGLLDQASAPFPAGACAGASPAEPPVDQGSLLPPAGASCEIGRASCRERV